MPTCFCVCFCVCFRTDTYIFMAAHTNDFAQVNKIRELPQHPNVVITHTDAPELFVWSTDQQPNRAGEKVCWKVPRR